MGRLRSTLATATALLVVITEGAPSSAQPMAEPKGSSPPAAAAAPPEVPDAGPGASAEAPTSPPALVEVAPAPPAASTPRDAAPAPAAGQPGWCPCGPPGSREAAFRCVGVGYGGERSARDVLVMGGGAFCVVGGAVAVLGIPLWAVGASGTN